MQLWLQAYEEVKNNLNCFRLNEEEQKAVMVNNLKYTEFLPYEEEIMDMIDFNSNDKKIWRNKDIVQLLSGANAQIIGKVFNKIANNFPEAIKISRTSKGVTYFMSIKEDYLRKKSNSVGNVH